LKPPEDTENLSKEQAYLANVESVLQVLQENFDVEPLSGVHKGKPREKNSKRSLGVHWLPSLPWPVQGRIQTCFLVWCCQKCVSPEQRPKSER
jgi:hypothetical protein